MKVKLYQAQVDGHNGAGVYTMTVRELGDRWTISIQDEQGNYIAPVHDFADSLEQAQIRACRRATHVANMDVEQSAGLDVCRDLIKSWTVKEIEDSN